MALQQVQVYHENAATGLNLLQRRYNRFKFTTKALQQVYHESVAADLTINLI